MSASSAVRLGLLTTAAVLWMLVAVAAQGQPPARSGPVELPEGEARALAQARCLACHGPDLIVQQRLTREGWTRELDKMIGWGAVVTPDERTRLADYFTRHYGAAPAPQNAAAEALLTSKCQVCHDRTLIDQQRLDATGWRRELDKMIGWGALVTDAEKTLLVEYLAGRSRG